MAAVCGLLAGCVGSIPRNEFEQMVRERGGGLSGDLVVDALRAIEAREGVDTLDVVRIVLNDSVVSVEVRSPSFDGEIDGWTYTLGHRLAGPTPEPDDDPADPQPTFPADAFDVAAVEAMIDRAVDETAVRDGWAQTAAVDGEGGMRIAVSITNERADETWVFDATGQLVGVA